MKKDPRSPPEQFRYLMSGTEDARKRAAKCKTCDGTGKEYNELIGEYVEGSKCPDCNEAH